MFLSTKRVCHLIRDTSHCPFRILQIEEPKTAADYYQTLTAFRKYNADFRRVWNRSLKWATREAQERDAYELALKTSPSAIKADFSMADIKNPDRRRAFYNALQNYYAYSRLPVGFGKDNMKISP